MKKSKKSKTSKLSRKPAPSVNVLPAAVGVDPATIIFPVWSDQDLNNEKWEFSPPEKSESHTSQEVKELFYKDPHEIKLPSFIKDELETWKRVHEVFFGIDVSLYKESSVSNYTDLVDGSSHILQSKFMRDFISTVGILEYLGYTAPWPLETPSATFIPTTNEPWRPWHHIYSSCKAGKEQTHAPKINLNGKYIVRLYWMGCWRKITIDDRLPVDSVGRVLLPTLTKYRYQYRHRVYSFDQQETSLPELAIVPAEIEVWPFLLAKAIMKIASLSWNEEEEIVDFSIISCLTGWIQQIISTKNLSKTQIWDEIMYYTEHYTRPKEADETKLIEESKKNETKSEETAIDEKKTNETKANKKKSKETMNKEKKSNEIKGNKKKSKETMIEEKGSNEIKANKKKSKDSMNNETKSKAKNSKEKNTKDSKSNEKSSHKGVADEQDNINKVKKFCLTATVADMREYDDAAVLDVTPCLSHTFLVDLSRNVPLYNKNALAKWKEYRWQGWALKKGLYRPNTEKLTKCFKMISPFRIYNNLIPRLAISEYTQCNMSSKTKAQTLPDLNNGIMLIHLNSKFDDYNSKDITFEEQTTEDTPSQVQTSEDTSYIEQPPEDNIYEDQPTEDSSEDISYPVESSDIIEYEEHGFDFQTKTEQSTDTFKMYQATQDTIYEDQIIEGPIYEEQAIEDEIYECSSFKDTVYNEQTSEKYKDEKETSEEEKSQVTMWEGRYSEDTTYEEQITECISCKQQFIEEPFRKYSSLHKELSSQDTICNVESIVDFVFDEQITKDRNNDNQSTIDTSTEDKSTNNTNNENTNTKNIAADMGIKDIIIDTKSNSKKSSKGTKASKSTDKSRSTKVSNKLPNVIPLQDPSIWCSFDSIFEFIIGLQVYIRPSQYKTHIRISDLSQPKIETTYSGITYSKDLNPSRNEPLYIFSDSLDCEFMVISLTQSGNRDVLTNTNRAENKKFVSTLVLEGYNWHENKISEDLTSFSTFGSFTHVLKLLPTRKVMRLWIKSESSFVIDILSNVPVYVGTSEQIFEKMSEDDSIMFLQACQLITSAFHDLVQSFGTIDYLIKMRLFHQSLLPLGTFTKIEKYFMYDVFYKSLINLIREKYSKASEDTIHVINILLLKLNVSNFKGYNLYDTEDFNEEEDSASRRIQGFFKKIYVKRMLAYHNPNTKKHSKIVVKLKKIGKEFDLRFISDVMRNMLLEGEGADINNRFYEIYYENIKSVINNQWITGFVEPKMEGWVPILRTNFFLNNKTEVIKINLFCNTDKYSWRVYNNDTREEVLEFNSILNVFTYDYNKSGYTVLGYAWSNKPVAISWKLSFITLKKRSRTLPLVIVNKNIDINISRGNYIPNTSDIICKYQIFTSKNNDLTFRFSCSCNETIFKLVFFDRTENEFASITSTGIGILHVANLEPTQRLQKKDRRSFEYNKEKSSGSVRRSKASLLSSNGLDSKNNFYTVKAYVLHDSWDLNREEWENIYKLPERNLIYDELFGEKRLTKSSIKNSRDVSMLPTISNPQFSLVTIFNKEETDTAVIPISIEYDKRRDEEIKAIKRAWFEPDLTRYTHGAKLRHEYLENNLADSVHCYGAFYSASSVTSTSISRFPSDYDYPFTQNHVDDNITLVDDSLFAVGKIGAGGRFLKTSEYVLKGVEIMEYYNEEIDALKRHFMTDEEALTINKYEEAFNNWKYATENGLQYGDSVNISEVNEDLVDKLEARYLECYTKTGNLIKDAYNLRNELMMEAEVSKKNDKIDDKKKVKESKLKKQKKQKK